MTECDPSVSGLGVEDVLSIGRRQVPGHRPCSQQVLVLDDTGMKELAVDSVVWGSSLCEWPMHFQSSQSH